MNFRENIKSENYGQIIADLQALITGSTLARFVWAHETYLESGQKNRKVEDLAQELFLILWQKKRFPHYIETGMTDVQITGEIIHVELSNLILSKFRKLKPESFRLARRISVIVQKSKKFRRFGSECVSLPNKMFGLKHWSSDRKPLPKEELFELAGGITPRKRDNRKVGCQRDPLIISTEDLEKLIVEVFTITGSPCSVRDLRGIVMSRITVFDVQLLSIVQRSEGEEFEIEITDEKPNRLDEILNEENIRRAENCAIELVRKIQEKFRPKRRHKIIRILHHWFLKSHKNTQIEVAAALGVSDSTVSYQRKFIENELQKLDIRNLPEAAAFKCALKKELNRQFGVDFFMPASRTFERIKQKQRV